MKSTKEVKNKKADSHQLTQPFVPKLPNLKPHIEARAEEPAGPELHAWQEALDDYASRKAHSQPLPTLDYKSSTDWLWRLLVDKVQLLGWPRGLYITAGADSKQYSFTKCPLNHRYAYEWVTGSPNKATLSDGHLFAYASPLVSDALLRSEAGIGFLFTPSAKLAVYEIQPTIAAIGQYRWDTYIAHAGGDIRLQGGVFTKVWSVSPKDGSLSLVTPFGYSAVFDHSFNNSGAIPTTSVTPPWAPGPPATYIMLEGSHTYLIGVIAMVQIDNSWTDDGRPIPSLPPTAIWRVWCSLNCVVGSVSVDAIYIP